MNGLSPLLPSQVFAVATIRSRKQADGTTRYTAIVRLRRGKTLVHQEARTLSLIVRLPSLGQSTAKYPGGPVRARSCSTWRTDGGRTHPLVYRQFRNCLEVAAE